ncbi:MAG: HlyD family efflux transporter periplasmic adaptor subunit [Oscillospiraceae bacterium]|nr:HlyD family efflux transporter periplasmic adaptor subunit [Oscillospiraceae bacterium]
MAQLYRKSALERISDPEQLDKIMHVTSPMSWLALGGITLIILVTLIWSFVGTIPETITVKGTVASATVGSNSIYTQDAGTVVSLRVRAGDELHLGDPVMTYRNAAGEIHVVYSDQVGTVAELTVKKDDKFTSGKDVIRVMPKSQDRQIVVCYVPLAQAKKLERGMQVNVTLDSQDSSAYGNMVARIINIDSYATPSEGMASVLGSNNHLEGEFTKNGAVAAVACELYPDASTASGYFWTNKKGSTLNVQNGSLVTARIVTEEVAPITKLFTKLKDIWGE